VRSGVGRHVRQPTYNCLHPTNFAQLSSPSARGGRLTRARRAAAESIPKLSQSNGDAGKPSVTTSLIPTICGCRPAPRFWLTPNRRRASAVTYIRADKSIVNVNDANASLSTTAGVPNGTVFPLSYFNDSRSAPSLYLLNAAALAKPHAVQHLLADLHSYNTDVAVITETHFKNKHNDSAVSVPGYTLHSPASRQRASAGWRSRAVCAVISTAVCLQLLG